MRLWHDDIRTPPDESWTWARTNDAAKWLLQSGKVTEISMDHDLGLHDVDPAAYDQPDLLKGQAEETGYDLVKWMCESGHLPGTITIHSWNPPGAKRMQQRFRDFGVNAEVRPFDLTSRNADRQTKRASSPPSSVSSRFRSPGGEG